MDVLIFDDDTTFAELIYQYVTEEGYTADKFDSGHGALERVKRAKPRLVILDIMMPTVDGLTICKEIKSCPETAGTKVIMVTSKDFEEDKAAAEECGATAYMQKGSMPTELPKKLSELLGKPAPDAGSGGDAPKPTVFQARVWGTRGGKTPPGAPTCSLSLHFEDQLVILDAGTGIKDLLLAGVTPKDKTVWLLLTHYHPSHISGLGYLLSALGQDFTLKIAGPSDVRRPLKDVVGAELQRLAGRPGPKIELFLVSESVINMSPDLIVRPILVMHPGNTLAYRIIYKGRSLVYCPDNEVPRQDDDAAQADFGEKLSMFVRSAEVLIHDGCFPERTESRPSGKGHSFWPDVIALAKREGVRRLLLFHMDSALQDDALGRMLQEPLAVLRKESSSLLANCARPGMVINV